VDAAMKVFARRGYDAASVDEIAAESGVSKGTIFLHFKKKDALIERVALASLPLAEVERVLKKEHKSPEDLLCDVGMAFLNKYRSEDLRSLLIMTLTKKDQYRSVGRRLRELCLNITDRVFEMVEAMTGRPVPRPMRQAFFGSLLCYVIWWNYNETPPEAYCRELVKDILGSAGLETSRAARGSGFSDPLGFASSSSGLPPQSP
jgi:AcrR family transcriptional regulator